MKRFTKTLAVLAIMGLGITAFVAHNVDAQVGQYYKGFAGNDFAVVDDSTSDTTFVITDNADSDTSIAYSSFLWQGCTMVCYSDAPHADSAGINVYLEGSIRGSTFTVLDSVNVTVDATPTYGTTDLRAGRYRYARIRIEGMASTDSTLNANVRLFYWGYK